LQETHITERRNNSMMDLARKFWNDESGQGLAEYALLLGLIVIGVVAIITGMGTSIKTIFGKANNDLKTAAGS
jgi:pilus assembly protein Flp/PilA